MNIPTLLRTASAPRQGLISLEYEALQSANFRGHKMGRFINNFKGKKPATRSTSNCVVCNIQVDVTTNPLPNDIEIGGEAVALSCK